MITGQIKRFLRDDGMIKVSRTLKENGWKIHQAGERLHHELGRSATVDEIAAATELEREEIVSRNDRSDALSGKRQRNAVDRSGRTDARKSYWQSREWAGYDRSS